MAPSKNNRKILADWGNTAARFFYMQGEQLIDERIEKDGGVKSVIAAHQLQPLPELAELDNRTPLTRNRRKELEFKKKRYDQYKAEIFASEASNRLGDWLKDSPGAPVVMAGAIGSLEGWSFVSYIPAPVTIDTLSENLYAIPKDHLGTLRERNVNIVHGLSFLHHGKSCTTTYDDQRMVISGDQQSIMRGEEVKAAGIYDRLKPGENLVCMPGTHSQWLVMEDRQIKSFLTFRSGELFQNLGLSTSSLFGPLKIEEPEKAHRVRSFLEGVHYVGSGGDLLSGMMDVRAGTMPGNKSTPSPRDKLSGLIIGREILAAMHRFSDDKPLTLLINPGPKAEYYRLAFNYFKYPIAQTMGGDDISLEGLKRVSANINGPEKPKAKKAHSFPSATVDAG